MTELLSQEFDMEPHPDILIDDVNDLTGKVVSVHWHFQRRKYSVSLRASNGRWYVVRDRRTEEQLFFEKLIVRNVRFRVQPAAARKAYKTGKRSVHATLTGEVLRAQYAAEGVVVPCGLDVAYSHSAYPEPEFKVNIFGYDGSFFNKPLDKWPGIESAEMAALGVRMTDQYLNKPQMLVAGDINLIERG